MVPAPVAGPGLPAYGTYNDLAVDPTVAGAFYLATSHPLEPLWWWDGAQCHPTTLGTLPVGTRSPAYSVVVDPATPTVVYVGTTVGVWQGTLTPPAGGNPPTWVWTQYSNGLPEAAVQDLAIGVYPRGGGAPLRLLRAALQARGLWEVDLDAPGPQQTYVRVHPYDTRRLLPTPRADPLTLASAPAGPGIWTGPTSATVITAPAAARPGPIPTAPPCPTSSGTPVPTSAADRRPLRSPRGPCRCRRACRGWHR